MKWANKQNGFTIVELLIVVVVIAILAAIAITSYTGIQQRARDSQRLTDIATIQKAIELYYLDNGVFPSAAGSTTINSGWSTTADSSWSHLENQLVPKYISKFPKDPTSTPNTNVQNTANAYNYAYFRNTTGSYCGAGNGQMYILVYRLESREQENRFDGACPTSALVYPMASNLRVVK